MPTEERTHARRRHLHRKNRRPDPSMRVPCRVPRCVSVLLSSEHTWCEVRNQRTAAVCDLHHLTHTHLSFPSAPHALNERSVNFVRGASPWVCRASLLVRLSRARFHVVCTYRRPGSPKCRQYRSCNDAVGRRTSSSGPPCVIFPRHVREFQRSCIIRSGLNLQTLRRPHLATKHNHAEERHKDVDLKTLVKSSIKWVSFLPGTMATCHQQAARIAFKRLQTRPRQQSLASLQTEGTMSGSQLVEDACCTLAIATVAIIPEAPKCRIIT